jgi:transcriptional antiterminator RfaH
VSKDDNYWYAIYSKPRQEGRALKHLSHQGYECFLPTVTVETVKNNAITVQAVPMFPRYLFIRLNQSTSNWMPIRSTQGVSNVVSFANQAARVPSDLIAALQAQPALSKARFEPNQTLTIQAGALAGFQGIFQSIVSTPDGQSRAMLLVELMHKTHLLSISVGDL